MFLFTLWCPLLISNCLFIYYFHIYWNIDRGRSTRSDRSATPFSVSLCYALDEGCRIVNLARILIEKKKLNEMSGLG